MYASGSTLLVMKSLRDALLNLGLFVLLLLDLQHLLHTLLVEIGLALGRFLLGCVYPDLTRLLLEPALLGEFGLGRVFVLECFFAEGGEAACSARRAGNVNLDAAVRVANGLAGDLLARRRIYALHRIAERGWTGRLRWGGSRSLSSRSTLRRDGRRLLCLRFRGLSWRRFRLRCGSRLVVLIREERLSALICSDRRRNRRQERSGSAERERRTEPGRLILRPNVLDLCGPHPLFARLKVLRSLPRNHHRRAAAKRHHLGAWNSRMWLKIERLH
jgi:hypothetical protein